MPFTENWVQHLMQQGRCLHCGRQVANSVEGTIWMKPQETDILRCPPKTNWTVCMGPQ